MNIANKHYFIYSIGVILFSSSVVLADGERGIQLVPNKIAPAGRSNSSGQVINADQIYDNSHAVVIGIDEYQELPKLTGAVRDANNVALELTKRGMNVKTFINRAATKSSITEYLGDVLPEQLGTNDRVLIYFAGHGKSQGVGDAAMGYLMPVGGKRDKIRSTGISMRELQAWIADYPSKHVLFIADACYSGLAIPTRSFGLSPKVRNYIQQITAKTVRVSLVAGSHDEVAHEFQGQGLFTRYFLEAIGGMADTNYDGLVTTDEIAAYVKPMVAQTAMTQFRAEQNPQMGRQGEGEFVFLSPDSKRTPSSEHDALNVNNGGTNAQQGDSPLNLSANDIGMPQKTESARFTDNQSTWYLGASTKLGFSTAVGSFDDNSGSAAPRFAGGINGLVNFDLRRKLTISTGIGIQNAGHNGNDRKQKLFYLLVPLLIQPSKINGFIIAGGFSIKIALFGHYDEYSDGEKVYSHDFSFSTFRRVNVAADFKLGYLFELNRIAIGPNFELSIHMINDQTNDVAEWTYRHMGFLFTFDVFFKRNGQV